MGLLSSLTGWKIILLSGWPLKPSIWNCPYTGLATVNYSFMVGSLRRTLHFRGSGQLKSIIRPFQQPKGVGRGQGLLNARFFARFLGAAVGDATWACKMFGTRCSL